MAEEELAQISIGEFENLWGLLLSSQSLQAAFAVMVVGLIGIVTAYRKFSTWVTSHKFYYHRPHASRFLRRAALPFFALALITTVNAYIQSGFHGEEAVEYLLVEDALAKILNTFNILVIGYTVAHLIPIVLNKLGKRSLEEMDFGAWFEMRGFSDDEKDLFHRLYKWIPPVSAPQELDEDEFKEMLKTDAGTRRLEAFRTSQGNPIGSYEKLGKDPFEEWKRSERRKYQRYYENCVAGKNQSGRKLRPDARPPEIFPIDVWREEKRIHGYEPIIPSSRPPGYAQKKKKEAPMSVQRILPLGIFIATILGVAAWWGIDLFVLATATGGFSIGLGLALQETMQNYFAYIMIRKDKIFVEGDRVQLESGYNGNVHKITPRVTYIMDALYESVAVIPTRQLVNAQIINYTKENPLVPAVVKVGVSYLNNPRQVAAILQKVGTRAMKEVVDAKNRHLIRQRRCPYLDENKPSCGCDKDLHVDVSQPVVRFDNFNDSSLDFSMWVYVRNYGSQFKVETDIRVMIYEEFERYDIRIPWPIRTIYQGDEKQERKEIGSLDEKRRDVVSNYGTGDLVADDGGQSGS